jgi:hypothetical protein
LNDVRDKIEKRYATALGSADLAKNTVQGRMMEVEQSTTAFAGKNRLEQIKSSLHGGSTGQIGAGASVSMTKDGEAANSSSGSGGSGSGANIQAEIQKRVKQAEQNGNG